MKKIFNVIYNTGYTYTMQYYYWAGTPYQTFKVEKYYSILGISVKKLVRHCWDWNEVQSTAKMLGISI